MGNRKPHRGLTIQDHVDENDKPTRAVELYRDVKPIHGLVSCLLEHVH